MKMPVQSTEEEVGMMDRLAPGSVTSTWVKTGLSPCGFSRTNLVPCFQLLIQIPAMKSSIFIQI